MSRVFLFIVCLVVWHSRCLALLLAQCLFEIKNVKRSTVVLTVHTRAYDLEFELCVWSIIIAPCPDTRPIGNGRLVILGTVDFPPLFQLPPA